MSKKGKKQSGGSSALSNFLINLCIIGLALGGIIWSGVQIRDTLEEIRYYKNYELISGQIISMDSEYIEVGEETTKVYSPTVSCQYDGNEVTFTAEGIYDSKPFSDNVKVLTNGTEFIVAERDIIFWHYLPAKRDRGIYFMGSLLLALIPLSILCFIIFPDQTGLGCIGITFILMSYIGIYWNLIDHTFAGLFFIPFGLCGLLIFYNFFIKDPEKFEAEQADADNAHLVRVIDLLINEKNQNYVYILKDFKGDESSPKLMYSTRFKGTIEVGKNYYIDARRCGKLKKKINFNEQEYIDISNLTPADFGKARGMAAKMK